jgi:NhaA family Na+:H+ antiporter
MSDSYYTRFVTGIRDFLRFEGWAGVVLGFVTVLALIASNSSLAGLYNLFLDLPVEIRVGGFAIAKPLLLWINDGLMAIFFLLVGLEVKREILEGELSSWDQALLPAIAATGVMVAPALIYVVCNIGDPIALRGWAIPCATDIAFAMGVLLLLGARIPTGPKVFLLALAIFDDLGAIVIIAAFYTEDLSLIALVLAAVVLTLMFGVNRLGISRTAPYALLGILLWVCVLKSGVHATLAGVAMALAIPMRGRDGGSLAKHLEHALHPWVAFLIMPIFGFANAGISFAGVTWSQLGDGVTLGIAAGLFIGKQIGVFGSVFICTRLGWARLPGGVSVLGLYGVAVLAGIGFTMSLFIGTLAWEAAEADHAVPLRLGVLGGSLLAGVVGYLVLHAATRQSPATSAEG